MKHGFLIVAHNNFSQLMRLVKKLDDKRSEIFIHIDAKAEFSDADKAMIESTCQQAKVHFTKRYNVMWGGYSQINAGLRVLEEASAYHCDYYHFLSGVDFPIKPVSEIFDFFENHCGTEFIQFSSDEFVKEQYARISLFHFFIEKCGRNSKSIYYKLERVSLMIQKLLFVDRTRKYKGISIKMGDLGAV